MSGILHLISDRFCRNILCCDLKLSHNAFLSVYSDIRSRAAEGLLLTFLSYTHCIAHIELLKIEKHVHHTACSGVRIHLKDQGAVSFENSLVKSCPFDLTFKKADAYLSVGIDRNDAVITTVTDEVIIGNHCKFLDILFLRIVVLRAGSRKYRSHRQKCTYQFSIHIHYL